MNAWIRYAAVSLVAVSAVVLGAWGSLGGPVRSGLALAGGVALGVQWAVFGFVLKVQTRSQGLLLGMAGGMFARFGALAVAGLWVSFGDPGVDAAALVLGLAGFLFALALLEVVFLRSPNGSRQPG